MKAYTFVITDEIREKLRHYATLEQRTQSALIRYVLLQYFKQKDQEAQS